MRTIGCCMLVLVLAAGVLANPRSEMKSSPLFKASLEMSIAKLEGTALPEAATPANNVELVTQKPGCIGPMAPLTAQPINTCVPYCPETTDPQATCYCTCYSTCNSTCSTCSGQSTCDNTCASTCASTCSTPSACVGCANPRLYGYVYKNGYDNNWYGGTDREVFESNSPGYVGGPFNDSGYYSFYCSSAARSLYAKGTLSGLWTGGEFKPSSNVDQKVDISVYRR